MRNGHTENSRTLGSYQRRVLLVWLSAVTFNCGQTCALAQNRAGNTGLELRLVLSKDQYEVGKLVTFRVEFHNRENQEVKIGFARDAIGRKLSPLLEFTDTRGKKLPPMFSLHLSPYGPVTKRDLLIVLEPHHFYGWEVSLTSFEYSFVGKPGLYQVQAFYEYHPPNEEVLSSQSLARDKERPSIFSGTLQSEPVWIKIVQPSP